MHIYVILYYILGVLVNDLIIKHYDYLFGAPYFSPACGVGKIYAKNLKFCIAAVFVVCQRENHIKHYICFSELSFQVFSKPHRLRIVTVDLWTKMLYNVGR